MLLLSLLITKLHVFRITFHLPVFFFLLTRLGLAYAGSNRQDVLSLILPVLGDPKSNLEVRVFCFEFELDILLYIFGSIYSKAFGWEVVFLPCVKCVSFIL